MSFNTCCVPGCRVSLTEGVLHKFPNPTCDYERFHRWISNIGSPISELETNFIFNNRRVCRKHFEKVFHYPKNRLCKLSVPTLFLPQQGSTHQDEEEGIIVNPVPEQPAGCSSQQYSMPALIDITNLNQTGEQRRSISNPIEKKQSPVESPPVPISCENIMHIPRYVTRVVNKQGRKKLPDSEIELRKIIMKLKASLRKMKKIKMTYKERLAMAAKAIKSRAFEILTQKMTKATKTFFQAQITEVGKKLKGRRFTLNQKILALSLYKASPKGYRLLSEICILPKRKTLQKLLQNLNLQPGINRKIMQQLKKKVAKMSNTHKYVTIIFDEMAIAPNFSYDKKNDKIIGFVEDEETRSAIIADHVLVFMVRGVVKKFKQPIMYSFCSGTTKSTVLKRMLIKVIQEVEETGLKVIATVCDQGSSNIGAINSLLNDTNEKYIKENKEWHGGFFEIGHIKIFPLFDPPHLIKGVRNNLMNKNLIYKLKNKKCMAKWEHIVDLYNLGPGYRGVRLVPKLTAHHVIPNLIPKMRVKMSTQVFSRTVGVAMGYMADEGKLPPESSETADILLFFDQLFDSVNGSYHKVCHGKIYRSAVTPTSPHHKLWRESLPILKSMAFIDNKGKKANVPSLSGWVKTIEGFRLICKYMHGLGVSSILLRHFNQDPLENFFGAIRAQGQNNIMPSAAAFQASYKSLLINNMVSPHSVGANCEKEESVWLHSLKYLFKEKCNYMPPSTIEILNEHMLMEPVDTENILKSTTRMDQERCAAVGYCSGWLIKLAKQCIYKSCSICKQDFESGEHETFHKFIKVKEYNEKGWLCYPSRNVFNIFFQIENLSMEILRKSSHQNNIFAYIKTIADVNVEWNFVTCEIHKENMIDHIVKKTILFCIYNWNREVNNIVIGKMPLWDFNDPIKKQANEHYNKNKKYKVKLQK